VGDQEAKLQLVISGQAKGAEAALKSLGQNLKTAKTQTATLNQSLKETATAVRKTGKGDAGDALAAFNRQLSDIGMQRERALSGMGDQLTNLRKQLVKAELTDDTTGAAQVKSQIIAINRSALQAQRDALASMARGMSLNSDQQTRVLRAQYQAERELRDMDVAQFRIAEEIKVAAARKTSQQTVTFGNAMKGLTSGIASVLKGVAVAGAAATAAIAGGAMGMKALTDSAARTAGEVERLVRVTGLSVEKASALRAGAQTLGVDMGTLDSAIQGMINNFKTLGAADNPFRMLGIQVVNAKGQLRDFDGILMDTLDRLQRMGPTAAREMFASKIFGGATPELLRMIDAGSDGLQKAAAAAKAMGLVLTPQQVQMAIQYRTSLTQLGQAWEGLKLQLGTEFMPMMTQILQTLVRGAQRVIPALRDAIRPVVVIVGQLWNVMSLAGQVAVRLFRSFMDTTTAGRGMANVLKAIQQAFQWFSNGLKSVSEWLTRLKERLTNTDVGTLLKELWADVKGAIDEKIQGLITWLNDPASAQGVADGVTSFLQSAFKVAGKMEKVAGDFLKSITGGLRDFFTGGRGSQMFNGLAQFIDNYAKSITSPENLKKIYEAGAEGGQVLVDGLGDMAEMGSDLASALMGLMVGVGQVAVAVIKNAPQWIEVAGAFIAGFAKGLQDETPRKAQEVWVRFWDGLRGAASSVNLSWLAQSVTEWLRDHDWTDAATALVKAIARTTMGGMLALGPEGFGYISDTLKTWIQGRDWNDVAIEVVRALAGATGIGAVVEGWGWLVTSLEQWMGTRDWSDVAFDLVLFIATATTPVTGLGEAWNYLQEAIINYITSHDWSEVAVDLVTALAMSTTAGVLLATGWGYIESSIRSYITDHDWSDTVVDLITSVAQSTFAGLLLASGWQYFEKSLRDYITSHDWTGVITDLLRSLAQSTFAGTLSAGGWRYIADSVKSWVTSHDWGDVASAIVEGIMRTTAIGSIALRVKDMVTSAIDKIAPDQAQESSSGTDGASAGSSTPTGTSGGGSLGTSSTTTSDSTGSPKPTEFASGGIFMPRPGGHDVNAKVAEAGKPEAFLPLDPGLFRQLGLSGTGVINLTVISQVDGREVGRTVKRIMMDDLKMQKQMAW
jgi:TRAP-type C4-dicarboxylate transport system permease small subunit